MSIQRRSIEIESQPVTLDDLAELQSQTVERETALRSRPKWKKIRRAKKRKQMSKKRR